jgi:hypothetical protein
VGFRLIGPVGRGQQASLLVAPLVSLPDERFVLGAHLWALYKEVAIPRLRFISFTEEQGDWEYAKIRIDMIRPFRSPVLVAARNGPELFLPFLWQRSHKILDRSSLRWLGDLRRITEVEKPDQLLTSF